MINKAIQELEEVVKLRQAYKSDSKKVVFTNGCFDILHAGHVDYLNKSKSFGDILIIGLNSDASLQSIKGSKRPIINQDERAFILTNLECVDHVIVFDDDTPEKLIVRLAPDVLVKGADWSKDKIVGGDFVESYGGKVERVEFISNQSTSKIIQTIVDRYKD